MTTNWNVDAGAGETGMTPVMPARNASLVQAPLTGVESWLMDLGLRAIEVDRCPIANCEACGREVRADAA